MVIQRWQSVLLFISALCMAIVCFIPFATSGSDLVMPSELTVFLVLNITTAVLLLVAIFMFNNMPRQRFITLLGIFLMVVSFFTGATSAYLNYEDVNLAIGGCALFVVAFITAIWAYRRIIADQKLLRAADRLR